MDTNHDETARPKPRPGNPRLLEVSEATRWPAVAPGEKMALLGVRIPSSLLTRLKAQDGTLSAHVRAAIEQYLECKERQ